MHLLNSLLPAQAAQLQGLLIGHGESQIGSGGHPKPGEKPLRINDHAVHVEKDTLDGAVVGTKNLKHKSKPPQAFSLSYRVFPRFARKKRPEGRFF
jgi:hypothetical protein